MSHAMYTNFFHYDTARLPPTTGRDWQNQVSNPDTFPVLINKFNVHCMVKAEPKSCIYKRKVSWKTNVESVENYIGVLHMQNCRRKINPENTFGVSVPDSITDLANEVVLISFRNLSTGTILVDKLLDVFSGQIVLQEVVANKPGRICLNSLHCNVRNFRYIASRVAFELYWNETADRCLAKTLMRLTVAEHTATGWII